MSKHRDGQAPQFTADEVREAMDQLVADGEAIKYLSIDPETGLARMVYCVPEDAPTAH